MPNNVYLTGANLVFVMVSPIMNPAGGASASRIKPVKMAPAKSLLLAFQNIAKVLTVRNLKE